MDGQPSRLDHWLGLAFTAATLSTLIPHIQASLAAGKWGLLIGGLIVPPVGVIHGLGVWLGAWTRESASVAVSRDTDFGYGLALQVGWRFDD